MSFAPWTGMQMRKGKRFVRHASILRGLRRCLYALLALPVLYATAALLLGAWPLNSHWQHTHPRAADVTTIWLTTNGVHAGLVLPLHHPQGDWAQWLAAPGAQENALAAGATHVGFGWGNRSFYVNTPQWRDLKVSTALYALSGVDSSLMRVDYGLAPEPGASAVAIHLDAPAYARLTDRIRASFKTDAAGRPQRLPGVYAGYAAQGGFYEAHGHYSLFATCNEWVRQMLNASGVRTPLWAPFDAALFWQVGQAGRPQ